MHKKKFDLIIFDLDGTLYPKKKEISRAFRKGAAKLVSRIEKVEFEEAVGIIENRKEKLGHRRNGKVTYTLTLFTYWNVSILDYAKAVSNSIKNLDRIVEEDKYAINALRKIVNNYSIFLYTTNNDILGERILKACNMAQFFTEDRRFTFSSIAELNIEENEIIDYIKPGKKGFEYILKQENADYEDCLMVGDSATSDIKPAEKLGMKTYHITSRPDLYNLPAWLGLEG